MRNFIICTPQKIGLLFREIKSRRIRWAGNVARMGEKRNAHENLVGKGTNHLGEG
jgi:hypothetical protein